MPIKYKMRFTGQDVDKTTGKVKKWRRGDLVEGEFDNLLPDTFKMVSSNTMASGKPKPVTKTRRRGRRKIQQ